VGDKFGRKYVIWVSILGVLPFTLLLPYSNLFWTSVLSVIIGLILASAFSAILVYAQELLPGRIGAVSAYSSVSPLAWRHRRGAPRQTRGSHQPQLCLPPLLVPPRYRHPHCPPPQPRARETQNASASSVRPTYVAAPAAEGTTPSNKRDL